MLAMQQGEFDDWDNEELVGHLLKVIDDLNDPHSWADTNHYHALTAHFVNVRNEILRRMA